MAGEARALLAKAEVVARTAGVAHDSLATISDRPHEAILGAAEARGCDLVFMASHGRRGLKGMVVGSQTLKVLQRATIPVLVSAVESNVAGAGSRRAARDHPRRAPLARGGDPRPRVRRSRSARQARRLVAAAARDRALRARVSGGAAPPEGRHVSLPAAARAHPRIRRDARRARTPARRGHGAHHGARSDASRLRADPAAAFPASRSRRSGSPPRRWST